MDSGSLPEEDANLARIRRRYNKLSLIFKFVFLFQFLAITALIIYLVHDANLESDRTIGTLNPLNLTSDPHSDQIFNTPSLKRVSEELDDVVSLILCNYSSSNIEVNSEFALKNCCTLLRNGSGRIREAVEANPFSDEMMSLAIIRVEEDVRSCVDDLEKVGSTVASEVRERVLRAEVYLRGSGDFLFSYHEDTRRKVWSMIDEAWNQKHGVETCFWCLSPTVNGRRPGFDQQASPTVARNITFVCQSLTLSILGIYFGSIGAEYLIRGDWGWISVDPSMTLFVPFVSRVWKNIEAVEKYFDFGSQSFDRH